MVFQSAIPTSVGLVLAPTLWTVAGSGVAFASAAITFASAAAIFLPMLARKRLSAKLLLVGGAFYVTYLLVVVVTLAHSSG